MKRSTIVALALALWMGGWVFAQPVWIPKHTHPTLGVYHHGIASVSIGAMVSGVSRYGGKTHLGVTGLGLETWDVSKWVFKPNSIAANPGLRWQHGMVGTHREVVLFGGNQSLDTAPLNDTWTCNRFEQGFAIWNRIISSSNPRTRNEPAMAFDAWRGKVVLFGGYYRDFWTRRVILVPNETWEFNPGVTKDGWSKLTGAGPSARYGTAMAYDPIRNQVVLFGGFDNKNALNDTWVLTGGKWKQLNPTKRPSARFRHQMVYNPERRRIVMMTGSTANSTFLNDVWEWDGTNWIQRIAAKSPYKRQAARAAWDWAGHVLLSGGYADGKPLRDTWALDNLPLAEAKPYGQGCKGSHGKVPLLSTADLPALYTSFSLKLSQALPSSVTPLAIGFRKADIDLGPAGAPGCRLYTVPAMLLQLRANSQGGWGSSVWFYLPAEPSLIGLSVYFQAGVLDVKKNNLGLITTNAIEAKIGY